MTQDDNDQQPVEHRLRRHPVRRTPEEAAALTTQAARSRQARLTRPPDDDQTHAEPVSLAEERLHPHAEKISPQAEQRAERLVAALFLVSAAGTLLFLVAFGFGTGMLHDSTYGRNLNFLLGAGMTLSFGGVGAAMVVWVKKLLPHVKAVQEREQLRAEPEDQLETERLFFKGADEMGIGKRKIIRRSMLTALGLLPIPFLFMIRDLGPLPRKTLRQTAWKPDARLVNFDSGQPIKIGDLPVGGFMTVMPEGSGSVNEGINALSPTMLIRLPAGVNKPRKGRENWAVDNQYVAYSKICTHAGCPVGLYEQQTHHLLCPCHQSTFDVPNACRVIFGPAARPLPQLPIYVDDQGYFRAQSGYHEPAGPSFWERGGVKR